ncbi:carboxymuconolactone decarboxylase family protein [Nonomuraea basaltis]|uniref:carboxymuconolactone decarboxylase family protein n=1 Tax=Nonomuraea basaltis TaxID=2495887 RepID=UPI00110C7028|nr:carboxymuconolactone decarboxylase family protein [Nonomuraea basaltis]TMR90073.1 carboxymuconolactone decarboxylase family protein [Nonomuraea basaltis]
MSRISLTPPPSPLLEALQARFARALGDGIDPLTVRAHQPQVLESMAAFERSLARWNTVPCTLKELAAMAVVVRVGCGWCIDFRCRESLTHGIPAAKIEAVPVWRTSALFTDLERLVLRYAEAMTDTPPQATDELVADLLGHFTEAQAVELTAVIAVENQRSRINAAFGLTPQGFNHQDAASGARSHRAEPGDGHRPGGPSKRPASR